MSKMVRTILITLDNPIPDTVVGETATITIGSDVYNGKVVGIVVHEGEADSTSVTLEGKGLKVTS